MRVTVSSAVIALGWVLLMWPQYGQTQSDRNFVFRDDDGHLLIRFAGTGASGLDASQFEEIVNAEFSVMVHDRLRADLLFAEEPRDPEWARSMQPQIEAHVERAGTEYSDLFVECRAVSCRVIMEQPGHWSVPAHQAVLETVQESLDAFIAVHLQHFEPVFMITAYYQEFETSHIKAFLRRTEHARTDGPAGE